MDKGLDEIIADKVRLTSQLTSQTAPNTNALALRSAPMLLATTAAAEISAVIAVKALAMASER